MAAKSLGGCWCECSSRRWRRQEVGRRRGGALKNEGAWKTTMEYNGKRSGKQPNQTKRGK